MGKAIKDIAASVRARLLRLSKANGQSFDLVLTRFTLERLLFRLSQSRHADRFELKGAMLLMSWFGDPYRGTRDLDLLGFGDPSPEHMLGAFREILRHDVDDGVAFDVDALRVDRIREETEYGGVRLRTAASIGGARISVTIDVGFGDALEPGVELLDYPSLLDFPLARLRAYARETVIAEKFQAMVALGYANSRLKDFYDIWILSRSFEFDGDRLVRAIAATFARRGTPVPVEQPDAFTQFFAADKTRQRQWATFISDVAFNPGELAVVVRDIETFLMPHAILAAKFDG